MALGMGGSGSNINGAMSETVSLSVAILMSVIGGWNALWQELADQARPALLGLPVAAREAPVEIKFRETRTDGDSLVRRLTLSDVVILGQARGQDWTWRAGEVIVEMRPAEAGRFSVLMPSPQHLEMSGPLGRGALVLWAVNLSAEVTLDETGLVREAVARGEGLTLTGMGMDSLAQSMVIALARDGDLTKINIDLAEIDLPAPVRFDDPVGSVVQRASLDAWVTGLGPPPPETATRWRDGGGKIGVTHFKLQWGDLDLEASGRVALDSLFRPEGLLAVSLVGLRPAVDVAHGAGLISESTRSMVNEGLDRIAALRGQDEDPGIDITLRMAGGRLSWAGFPVATLPAFGEPAELESAAEHSEVCCVDGAD